MRVRDRRHILSVERIGDEGVRCVECAEVPLRPWEVNETMSHTTWNLLKESMGITDEDIRRARRSVVADCLKKQRRSEIELDRMRPCARRTHVANRILRDRRRGYSSWWRQYMEWYQERP